MSREARAEAAGKPVATRLSPSERERVERAARVNRQNLSDFKRDALLDRADEVLDGRDS